MARTYSSEAQRNCSFQLLKRLRYSVRPYERREPPLPSVLEGFAVFGISVCPSVSRTGLSMLAVASACARMKVL